MEQDILSLSQLVSQHISSSLGITLTKMQVKQFVDYLNKLQAWNEKSNLTTITVDEEIVIKHFVDSLAGLNAEQIRPEARILDIGTGAGFPGVPLKIVRPDLSMTLLEPVQKKVSFLRFIVGHLMLENMQIYCETIKQFACQKIHLNSFDYVTSRAVKCDVILEDSASALSKYGKCILYLSKPISKSDIGSEWSLCKEYSFDLPNKYGARVISVLAKN